MIKPDPKVILALGVTIRQYPELLEWIRSWRMHELEQLPQATHNTAQQQGRCQVLGELERFAAQAPDYEAKP